MQSPGYALSNSSVLWLDEFACKSNSNSKYLDFHGFCLWGEAPWVSEYSLALKNLLASLEEPFALWA